MSQNARVALWVPTTDAVDVGDGVGAVDLPDSIKRIPTDFMPLGGGSGGGGGIPEAPSNGKPYVRQDAGWLPFDVIDGGTF